jgi:uncharacterized protein YecT (DUF1311 family)
MEESSLRIFLQSFDKDKGTRYIAAFRDLNGDGKAEAIVYLVSNEWCGSGGCNTLILARDGDSWRIITNMTVTQLPIRVLTKSSHGWRSIGVWVQGGSILPGYEAEMDFDGKTYPANPTAPPARRLDGIPTGAAIVIHSVKDATPLYGKQARAEPPSQPVRRQETAGRAVLRDSQAARPSFDCTRANSPTEKLICKDSELAALDARMAAAYQTALRALSGRQRETLRREQSAWFAKYARACNSVALEGQRKECVIRYLSARVMHLRLEHYELR